MKFFTHWSPWSFVFSRDKASGASASAAIFAWGVTDAASASTGAAGAGAGATGAAGAAAGATGATGDNVTAGVSGPDTGAATESAAAAAATANLLWNTKHHGNSSLCCTIWNIWKLSISN